MINNDTVTSFAPSSFDQLPAEAQTLFTMYVIASLACVGYSDVPEGRSLRTIARATYEQLGIRQELLSDPFAVSEMLDDYFGKCCVAN